MQFSGSFLTGRAMNLASLIQHQNLATLLNAVSQTAALTPGRTVEALLTGIEPEGNATAIVADRPVSLVLAGPVAREAKLVPGSVLVLKIEAQDGTPGAAARAVIVEVRPPATGRIPGATPAPATAAPERPSVAAATADPAPAQAKPATDAQRPAAPVATPRAVAGALLAPALARQGGLAPLFANLRALSDGSVSLMLPRPLLAMARSLLAQSLQVEGRPPSAETLRDAVARSGTFSEARQAAGQPPDLKQALVELRDWVRPLAAPARPDGQPPRGTPSAAPAPSEARPPPPLADRPPSPQPPALPTLGPADPIEIVAATLLRQTEAALDRVSLTQLASLPPESARAEAPAAQRWHVEIPLATAQGAAMLPLLIEREPPRRDDPTSLALGPVWTLRFALDLEPLGPLQGSVALRGRHVAVQLWAEREETSRTLRHGGPALTAALEGAHFEQASLEIVTGRPAAPKPAAGQFLDRLS